MLSALKQISSNLNKTIVTIALCAVAGLMLSSCTTSSVPEKPTITVSIEPQRWLLEQIVGDKINVNTILSTGTDPENFEPTFSNMRLLEQSCCYMRMGNFGFEDAIMQRITSNHPDILIINTSDSVPLIIEHNHEHCNGVHEHGIDPHIWNSASNARIIAHNMYKSVVKLDSIHTDYYKSNFAQLIHKIDSIDSICAQTLQSSSGNAFIVWHPSLTYFARDYDLRQIAVGFEGKELSLGETQHIIDLIEQEEATVFLVEGNGNIERTQLIATEIPTVKISTINPLNYEWDKELVHTAAAIAGE